MVNEVGIIVVEGDTFFCCNYRQGIERGGNNPQVAAGAYDSWIEWITVMDHFVSVVNGIRD